MKRIFLAIICLLIISISAHARMNLCVFTSQTVGGGGSGPYDCDTFSGLACEDFEGSTACEAAGDEVCRHTYDYIDGTIDWNADASTYGMYGTYCARVEHGDNWGDYTALWTARDSVYFLLAVRFEDLGENDDESFFSIWGGGTRAYYSINANGSYGVKAYGGADYVDSAAGLVSAGTTYWFRGYYVKGTGSDAEAWLSRWGGSSWDAYIKSTDGTETDQVDGFVIHNAFNEAAERNDFDMIKISATEFTNAPDTY